MRPAHAGDHSIVVYSKTGLPWQQATGPRGARVHLGRRVTAHIAVCGHHPVLKGRPSGKGHPRAKKRNRYLLRLKTLRRKSGKVRWICLA